MELQIPLLSDDDCKQIITKLCKKLCVRPQLVVTRLLSEDDKNDMRNGDLPIESLECHIKVWVDNGMPDYAHGKTEPYYDEQKRIKREKPFNTLEEKQEGLTYRKPFIPYAD